MLACAPAAAQLDSLPAKPPRTEAEFLARYGANDSARALIRWWFHKRRDNAVAAGAFGAITIVGGAMIGKLFTRTTVTEAVTFGPVSGFMLFGGGIGTVISLASRPALSRERLVRTLENPQLIGPRRWRRIIASD